MQNTVQNPPKSLTPSEKSDFGLTPSNLDLTPPPPGGVGLFSGGQEFPNVSTFPRD